MILVLMDSRKGDKDGMNYSICIFPKGKLSFIGQEKSM